MDAEFLRQITKWAAKDAPITFLKMRLMLRHDFKHFHDAVERRDGFVKHWIEQQLGLPCPLAVERLNDQLTLGGEEMVKAAFLHMGVLANFFDPDSVVTRGEYEVDGTFDEAFARIGSHFRLHT